MNNISATKMRIRRRARLQQAGDREEGQPREENVVLFVVGTGLLFVVGTGLIALPIFLVFKYLPSPFDFIVAGVGLVLVAATLVCDYVMRR